MTYSLILQKDKDDKIKDIHTVDIIFIKNRKNHK